LSARRVLVVPRELSENGRGLGQGEQYRLSLEGSDRALEPVAIQASHILGLAMSLSMDTQAVRSAMQMSMNADDCAFTLGGRRQANF